MTPETARPDTQSARPNPQDATTKARKRQSPVVRFPGRLHLAVTAAMINSLRRLTGGNSLLAEADIGRLALHGYLLANDPLYQRELGGSNGKQ